MSEAMRNLGVLQGPLILFGGPYSNLQATERMHQIAEQQGIPAERVICNGDVVAYCGDPEETTALIRRWGIPVLMGNCEESLGSGAVDCGCGFEQGSACDLLAAGWYRYASVHLGDTSKRWMRELPRLIRFRLGDYRVAVIHGGVEQINQFIFASSAVAEKKRQLELLDVDVIVGGHCGLPFGQRIGDRRLWLNSGVIGMPANDGSSNGWYLRLELQSGALQCRWHRLGYASELARLRMLEQGLSSGYAEALISGRWPSEDVLPEEERAQAGIAVQPPELRLDLPAVHA